MFFSVKDPHLNAVKSFWKRVHNAKEVVNLQGLLALIVGSVDVITYSLTKYYHIIERVYFIYRLFIFYVYHYIYIYQYIFILVVFFIQYIYNLFYKRDDLHPSIDISFYIMFYIINTMKLNRQFFTTFVLTIQKRSRFEPSPLVPPVPVHSL